MPTLEQDEIVFRFPKIEEESRFRINFQRTLRIPDTDTTYSLPPGLSPFPVRHVEDYAANLPPATTARGGVILPMWQAEAMWMSFSSWTLGLPLDFPVAIKIAAGKINAVTGELWRPGLHREPQDYMVSPGQPWLDGFAIEKGVIRQFVAMPLGDGYSVEEQVTGEAEWGGLQISVVPLKESVWKIKRAEREAAQQNERVVWGWNGKQAVLNSVSRKVIPMALAAGGRMMQDIYEDTFDIDDWDIASADRVFVTLVHAKDWKAITDESPPNEPPTARDYSEAGLPWFDYYGKDQKALPGGAALAGVMSVAKMFKKITGASMSESSDVKTGNPMAIGPGAREARDVRSEGSWED